MSKFILGTKLGMTQVYSENGKVTPVTVISIEPNVVVQVKTKEKDGYVAVQIGTGSKKRITKAIRGHLKGAAPVRYLREFKGSTFGEQELEVGNTLDAAQFQPGEFVKVTGISKGKGFAGAMKRHGFSGMPASHGHTHVRRHIGSIGQRFPQHTLKGKKMAGRTGRATSTVRGVRIVSVDPERGILAISGSVPGNNGSLVKIITL